MLEGIAPDRIRDHPANSPDFNVCEDIWAYLDREARKKRITTIDDLKQELKKAWNSLPWDYIRRSVASMSTRLQQCIDRDGKRTDY